MLGEDSQRWKGIGYTELMGIWRRVTSVFFEGSKVTEAAEQAQSHPDVRDVVGEVLMLRALPAEKRVLPVGRLGQAVAELLPGVERLRDAEVLPLHAAHIGMYHRALVAVSSALSLDRLAEIAADSQVDRRWRAGAVMELSRLGPQAASVAPLLHGLLDEFPAGDYTAQHRDLLCATATALCSIGEAAAPFLPSLLAVFDHPAVQANDRMSCPFGSVSIRAHLVEQLAPFAGGDERMTMLFEQCLFDEDVSLQLAAAQALTRSRDSTERSRAALVKALQAVQQKAVPEESSDFEQAVRLSVCHAIIQGLSRQ